MSDLAILVVLYGLGLLLLVAEIFIPSHGVLSVAGLGVVVAAVVRTFSYAGRDAGVVAILVCLVLLPVLAYVSIRVWPHTAIGRRIAPPNPVLTDGDGSTPVGELRALVGRTGRTLSPLRPVGICEFDGRRVSCVAEMGVVEASQTVVATGIKSGNLTVRVAAT
ncbi:MAG: hypothetical protein ACE5EX_03625 [Phycisphaerae bacterium]